MRAIFLFFIFLSVSLWAVVPSQIGHYIAQSKIPSQDISIYITDVVSGEVIASHNANIKRKPASVEKVLATYASLLSLGFEYRWPTRLVYTGEIYNGKLSGDLIVKGYGDPTLMPKDVEEISQAIFDKGIREIKGSIVIDRSYFDVGDKDSAFFDNNPYSPYSAMPDAMMYNERLTTVCVEPSRRTVRKAEEDPSYQLVNNVRFVNTACAGKYTWASSNVNLNENIPKVILSGQISTRCGEKRYCQIAGKPYYAFYFALKNSLIDKGVKIHGNYHEGVASRGSKILFTHHSQTLEEIVSKTSKTSNNLYARHLFLYTGARYHGEPATLEKSRSAIYYLFAQEQIDIKKEVFVENGSGLSRKSYFSAFKLSEVLASAYRKFGSRWMQTLSIGGVDGTIKRRFRGSVAHAKTWMKTGTLKNVKNIAGYVQNRSGRLYNVVILVNSKKSTSAASKLQDDIIKWLASTSGGTRVVVASPIKNKTIASSKEHFNIEPIEQKHQPKQPKTLTSLPSQIPVSSPKEGKFWIQVSASPNKPKAVTLETIRKNGFEPTVIHQRGYKVRIGSFPTKKEALKALLVVNRKIAKDAFVISVQK